MHVAFIANNHTSGGNSGSPVLNGEGQLIGINFDRVWEGTMSDIMSIPTIAVTSLLIFVMHYLLLINMQVQSG